MTVASMLSNAQIIHINVKMKVERVFEVRVTFTKLPLISPLFIPINSNLVEMFNTLFMSIKPRYIGPCGILQKSEMIL